MDNFSEYTMDHRVEDKTDYIGRRGNYWMTKVWVNNQRLEKTFSVDKYGNRKAIEMAIDMRQQLKFPKETKRYD